MASGPVTPKAVYVSVSVEPCNSEETRKYWAERAARAKAGLANPSALVNRASGEFDQGLVNAILAGKGELIATTVDGVREDNSMSTTRSGAHDVDGTVVHHDVSDDNSTDSGPYPVSNGAFKGIEPFPSAQSVSSGFVLRSSDPFVDKHTTRTRASSQQSSCRHHETPRYHVPMDNNVGPPLPPASTPTASSSEDDIFVGGEPGPDVGHRYRADSRVSQPSTPTLATAEDCHNSNNNVHPGTSRPSFSICTVSRSGSRTASRRPSAVNQKSSVSSLRSNFSSRKLSTASSDDQDQDERPIVVTNALHHILYDGPCGHCETNHCACLAPGSPGLPPIDAPSNSRSHIATEGFCRHCVLSRCSCVVADPRWGLHHAADTLRRAQQQQQRQNSTEQGGESSEQQSLRVISDTGTVRHYAMGHDDSPNSSSTEGQAATTTITNTAAALRTPPPAYRAPFSRVRSSNDDGQSDVSSHAHHPAVDDVEAQEQQGQSRRRFRLWRIRCQPRSRSRNDLRPEPTTGDMTRRFYECLAATLAAVLIIVGVWYYTNHNNHAAATEQQSPTGPY
ncbi:hypothetical protein PG985_006999 [Apiospora marii]|uniref:Uncharacterized protein n=1 Tax=Apiospora marii TaxID=335849 RepID=A0ABR1SFC1_9PEZI